MGKTALTIKLARHFKTEVVSADSRQFYKEMCIGTARPSPEELSAVSHHFIASHSIKEPVNIGVYEKLAVDLLKDLFLKHDIIFLTGGSGLYINAVTEGLDNLPESDSSVRNELNRLFEQEGIHGLQKKLKQLDPLYYEIVDQNNPHRLIRALEVCIVSGKTFSSFRNNEKKERPWKTIKIFLNLERDKLYQRINERVDTMLAQGLKEEAEALLPYKNLTSLQTVGYQELFDFFDGKYSFEQAVNYIKQNTRRYAKRQLTWFRRDKEYVWFRPEEYEEILKHIILEARVN